MRPRVHAVTDVDLELAARGKRSFLRVWLEVQDGAYVISPVSGSGSHLIAGMARANALAVVPEDVVRRIEAGSPVEVLVLERRGR